LKTYLRILSYAKPFGFIPFFVITTVLATLFETLNLGSIAPILNVLFLEDAPTVAVGYPEFSFSIDYFKQFYNWGNWYLTTLSDKTEAIKYLCFALLSSIFLANLFVFSSRFIMAYVKARMIKNIRVALFNKINRLHIGYFSNEKRGDLISRMTNDIQEIENSIVATLNGMLKEPVRILFTFYVLFKINSDLMIFSLLVLPISGLVIGFITSLLRKKARQGQTYLGSILGTIDETLNGVKIIQSFNAQDFISNKFLKQNEKYERALRSMDYKKGMASPVSQFLGVSVFSIILFYGGSLVFSGEMEASLFIAFLLLFANVVSPLKSFYTNITSVQRGVIAGGRVFHLLDFKEDVVEDSNAETIDGFTKSIDFKGVSFKYEEEYVLKNIDLTIEKGKAIALVGPSGGGKSTLVDLIPRFYDVQEGEILVDGKNIKKWSKKSLRGLIGVVTQESILFNDTIFNNIAFGLPNATQEAVENAAKVANAHDFILNTENGYNTEIGDRGVKLSGGQRQRLSIARAVLKNPPILILDEATSALDTESEKLVQSALENLMENRTSIVIAHRLSTIKNTDEIIVIKKGEVVEKGTHTTLKEQKGVYYNLKQLQS